MLALADVIKILNDDDAHELFKKTLPGGSALIQFTANTQSLRARARILQMLGFCGNLHLPVFIKKTLPGGKTKMFLFRFMLESGLRNGRLRSFVDCLSFLRSFHSLFPARTLHSCVYGQHSLFPCTYPRLTISCAYPLVIPHPRNLHVMPLNGVRLERSSWDMSAYPAHYSQRVPSTHYFWRVPSTHCYPARAQHSLFPARA